MAEVKYKDPNMYAEGVLAYREQFSLVPNRGYRQDIAVTVKSYEDLCTWQDLLSHWGYMRDGKWHARNPMDIKSLLTVFEAKVRERERNAIQQNGNGVHRKESLSKWPARRMSKSRMPTLLERKGSWQG